MLDRKKRSAKESEYVDVIRALSKQPHAPKTAVVITEGLFSVTIITNISCVIININTNTVTGVVAMLEAIEVPLTCKND